MEMASNNQSDLVDNITKDKNNDLEVDKPEENINEIEKDDNNDIVKETNGLLCPDKDLDNQTDEKNDNENSVNNSSSPEMLNETSDNCSNNNLDQTKSEDNIKNDNIEDKQKPDTEEIEEDQHNINNEEDKQNTSAVEDKQNTSAEDVKQDISAEEDKQCASTEEDKQDSNSENDKQDSNSEDDKQGTNVEEDKQNSNVEEDKQNSNIEEDKQDSSVEEDKQGSSIEEDKQDSNVEEGKEGSSIEEDKPSSSIEEDKPGSSIEEDKPDSSIEDKPGSSIEEDKPGSSVEENKQDSSSEDGKQGANVEEDKQNSNVDEDKQVSEEGDKQDVNVEESEQENNSNKDKQISNIEESTQRSIIEQDTNPEQDKQESDTEEDKQDFNVDDKDKPVDDNDFIDTENTEKSISEITANDLDSSDTSNKDNEKNDITDDNDKTDIVDDNDKTDIVDDNDKTDIADDNDKTDIADDNDKTDIVDDNEGSENGNPVFVHVNTEKVDDKTPAGDQNIDDDEPQEDPIASDTFTTLDEDDSKDAEQGADEELCIIPDTERIISQEEKEAASALTPLHNLSQSEGDNIEGDISIFENDVDYAKGKYVISKYTDEVVQECVQCLVPRKANYVAIFDKKSVYICNDSCLNSFKEENPGKFICNIETDIRVKSIANDSSFLSKIDYSRQCMECNEKVDVTNDTTLSWETMDFCGELCLGKYQKSIGGQCCTCQTDVRTNCLGKYCVRFGNDLRQFCSSNCLEDYKKKLKICSMCQKDMSQEGGGFLAPVGDKGLFKDFCSELCMEKYNTLAISKLPKAKDDSKCSVCLNNNAITIEYEHDNKNHQICSLPCFIAFKFVNKITPGKCDKCLKYFDIKVLEKHCMFFEDSLRTFCTVTCKNLFLNNTRRIVPCSWCKVKKYNFDMIRRLNSTNQILMMCSLNCLSLYQVSVNAVHSKKIVCDQCLRNLKPLYHLTMSDATLRNFCSYECVMAFQNQFAKTPITLNEQEPVPTGQPKRAKRNLRNTVTTTTSTGSFPSLPVISNVQSLATTNGTVTTRSSKSKTQSSNNTSSSVKTQIKQQLIIKPMPLPPQRNVATMCKVQQITKGVSIKPSTATKEVQTDEVKNNTIIIPIPVPIYVPSPVQMYSLPFPVPVPFALPVPVPIFIPTTRNSANGIMKEIKKIQVKIPTDPFEAELLMMAEMVAGDKKEEHTDSESEEEDNGPADEPTTTFSPEPVDASNTFGDDMLQMALKMATELDEPAVDLEGALTANTITASQSSEASSNEESADDPQPIHHMIERQSTRGRKRTMRQTRQTTASKRGRRIANQVDMPMMAPPQPPPPPEPVEKPDANMCLKYTFGVNAWKQWVTTKNAELEKSSRRVKLFKPEILQLTADELNYSLCLFVKEVRKPNGSEYAPDTIYYLCLGIQQYLFENGRIDNIFCDAYYEKFTDCLDEVARKFSVLYNDSHYIVTRVEEEHLWESKQLGAHSPHVLLSTLMFFNTKHFNLTSVDEHMQLSFSHIMKHWKRNPNQPGTAKVPGSRNVLLRFYPPQSALEGNARKKKVYEQQENEGNPLRCPVKLYEFYLSKCPESVKTRNDVFYLQPERSCVPDSPVWYSTMPLGRDALEKMLHRVKMVKEINVALLTS